MFCRHGSSARVLNIHCPCLRPMSTSSLYKLPKAEKTRPDMTGRHVGPCWRVCRPAWRSTRVMSGPCSVVNTWILLLRLRYFDSSWICCRLLMCCGENRTKIPQRIKVIKSESIARCPSVCLSVSSFITSRYCTETSEIYQRRMPHRNSNFATPKILMITTSTNLCKVMWDKMVSVCCQAVK